MTTATTSHAAIARALNNRGLMCWASGAAYTYTADATNERSDVDYLTADPLPAMSRRVTGTADAGYSAIGPEVPPRPAECRESLWLSA